MKKILLIKKDKDVLIEIPLFGKIKCTEISKKDMNGIDCNLVYFDEVIQK